MNPIAINSLDVIMAPDHSDLGSESEGGKEDTEQVNGGIAQAQTAEHETLLDKEPVGKYKPNNIIDEGSLERIYTCKSGDESTGRQ